MKKQIIKKAKCITIIGKEWFDKINGNSYFSAQILINNETKIWIPYTSGYGDQYVYVAYQKLKEQGYVNKETRYALTSDFKDQGINLYYCKMENCSKKDVISWGTAPKNLNNKEGE